MKYPFIGPNQQAKSHWKHICWKLNVFSKRPRKDMELTVLKNININFQGILSLFEGFIEFLMNFLYFK